MLLTLNLIKMNQILFFSFSFFFLFGQAVAQKNIHAPWGQMLKAYVAPSGKVNYAEWKNESKKLGEYINTLAQMPPQKTWPKTQQLAYWINAYNALTIQLILKHYPLKSIKDLNKPWDKVVFESGGNTYSLNNIEHNVLRKMEEPRIHFAINCASASCPKLQNKPFVGNQIYDQLEAATCAFLLDTTKNNFSASPPQVSRIFLWFGKDFGTRDARKLFFEKYLEKTLASSKLDYLDYDWRLNE